MEKLKQVLAQEDTVLFIGSGVSLWSGLPTWTGMVEELAQFVESTGADASLIRKEARRGELLQAASYGFDKLTKQLIGEFIRAACRYGTAKPHDIHRKIVTLGPRCFITTNYDDLLEQSLRLWQTDRFYRPPVTNRHLTEIAEIVHARAIDFIFKPHGDAGDCESIVLTREQYRQLLPQGERQAALESVKMLLASRPVVYLGFGLRDPDFVYVRDLLANTYKGGSRDHYAIMSDVSNSEIEYWRRQYGIHLFNYSTKVLPDNSRDHTELLHLLDVLVEGTPAESKTLAFDPSAPEALLALARYATALARTPKLSPEFSIRVHLEEKQTKRFWGDHDRFHHSPVEHFLDYGPERAVLIGLPGAGKSYSLRRAAARLAESLNKTCLAETFDHRAVLVPIFADMKLYRGSLSQLVSQTLPSSLPLDELVSAFKVKVFLDSFNEMPREFWESGSYEADFQLFIKSLDQASVVIGSRTSDGLGKLELPVYCLDQIDEEAVAEELRRLGITIEGRLGSETRRLLQRPFYFQYVAAGLIQLPENAHPRDFYKGFFANINSAFASRFGSQMDLDAILSSVAYESLDRGEEVFPISDLLSALKKGLHDSGNVKIQARDIANWLVSVSVLLPYSGNRASFVHQSVTEYLASTELANRYLRDPHMLKEKLSLMRWDQALFLALSLLPAKQADQFLLDVMQADFVLALRAVKYLETDRDIIVSSLLKDVPQRLRGEDRMISERSWNIAHAIESGLPLSQAHEADLRAIIGCGGSLGGAAVIRLVELRGIEIKDEIMRLLLDRQSEYNFCVKVGRALKPFATEKDASTIATWADIIQVDIPPDSAKDSARGFISGAAEFLSLLDLSVIRNEFLLGEVVSTIPEIRSQILCSVIKEHHSTVALNFAGELLLKGVKGASASIYFVARHGKDERRPSWASFTHEHVTQLQNIIETTDHYWGLTTLKCLCSAREDLAALVHQSASQHEGITKAALLYCANPSNLAPVFDALTGLITQSMEERKSEPFDLLMSMEIDWSGREDMFMELLRMRDANVVRALLGPMIPLRRICIEAIEIGAIEWWLEWMLEVRRDSDFGTEKWFALSQIGALFASKLSREARTMFVVEFNNTKSKYRRPVLDYILPHCSDLTTDDFSEDSISFLLADLNRVGAVDQVAGGLLGRVATERFIKERLLPLLPDAESPLADNLRLILVHAGSRHGRRYFIE